MCIYCLRVTLILYMLYRDYCQIKRGVTQSKAIKEVKLRWICKRTKDTPWLTVVGELLGAYCEYLGRESPRRYMNFFALHIIGNLIASY